MDIHYNAFISYRHHPEDIRVATEIHRSLERYKVPKAIRKKTKGITRLFRDKEELPITSDLTTDITRALRNSDYLIVICSVHTRESSWVQREIETFLQTHDRNKVLTVLVNGEPYETIPEILLYDEKVDPATGETVRVPVEPLSCDWRMTRRKARREELPRLAAALLGCGYNELRQRERQYRMQRMVAVFSVALTISLSFLAYFIYTSLKIQQANERLHTANERIQENLEQALKNQSLFLANESGQLLTDGDRLTAMALALEALPEYEGERTYVAEAELALAEALGAYDSEGTVAAVGAMDCGAMVQNFVVSDDGKTVYILDARNVISVWDAETLRHIGSAALSFTPAGMTTTASGNLLVYENVGQIACCGPDGRNLWTLSGYSDIAFMDGRSTVMTLKYEMTALNEPYLCTVRFLDADTGEEVREPLVFSDPGGQDGVPTFLTEHYSGDMPLGFSFSRTGVDLSVKAHDIVLVDCGTGEGTYLTTFDDCRIRNMGYTAAGDLLVMCETYAYPYRGVVMNMYTTGEARGSLRCLDPETGALLWEAETISYLPGQCKVLQTIPGSNDLLLMYDNVFYVIDSVTGGIIASGEASSVPLWVEAGESSAKVVLDDGSSGLFYYDDGSCSTIQYMKDRLTLAQRHENTYYVSEELGTQVIVYTWLNDTNCQSYEGSPDYLSGDGFAMGDGCMAFESYGKVWVLDAREKKLRWTSADDGRYPANVQLLGFSEDGRTLWCVYSGQYPYELIAYDAESGSSRATVLTEVLEGSVLRYRDQYRMCGGKLYALAGSYETGGQFLLRMDADTGAMEHWSYHTSEEREYGHDLAPILLAVTERYALIWESATGTVYEIDTEAGTARTIAQGVESRPAAEIWDDDRFIIGVDHEIQVRVFAGDAETVMDLGEKKAGAFRVHDGQLIVLCDNRELCLYDMTGVLVSTTELCVYNTFYTNLANDPTRIDWFFTDDGDLIVNAFTMGNVVDCETWQLRAYIPSFLAYNPVGDDFLVNSSLSSVSGVGSYPRYTTEDMIAMAREALNGFELTQEQRAAYGLLDD